MDTRKTAIHNFIINNFSDYDVDRCLGTKGILKRTDVTTYEQFVEYQKVEVEKLEESRLSFLEALMLEIKHMKLCDKEHMCSMDADGFVLVNGKIIITNDR